MITYIKKDIKGYYIQVPDEIDSNYWAGMIGSTYQDFRDNKWIKLSNEQVAFHETNPGANIQQVLSMTLPEPYVRTLEDAKSEKINQINMYDNSSDVNSFNVSVDGNTLSSWLTPSERSNYKNSIEALEMLELDTVTLYIQDTLITLSIENAKIMLAQIQLYADACYLTTKQHIKNIEELNSIEQVDNYDYTTGYPEKLTFNV